MLLTDLPHSWLMALAGENPERLYMALKAATSLLQAQALIVGGLAERDLAKVQHQLPELPVKLASEQACDPSWAAASAPLEFLGAAAAAASRTSQEV